MYNPALNEKQFKHIASYIESTVGIKMPIEKKLMMQSRLNSRLKALNYSNFDDYINFVFSKTPNAESELVKLVDAMTTNLTEFFREPAHFDYLTDVVLPQYAKQDRTNIKLWSVGCSSGQEPYTLSIVMSEYLRKNQNSIRDFSVLASDVSTRVLKKGINAVYEIDTVTNLPLDLKKRYFLKGKNQFHNEVRVKPELRKHVKFMHLNVMNEDFGFRDTMQIIFCRNMLIYFDKPTQENVINKFLRYLEPGGYLFLGHSETIFGMDLPFKSVAPTVFQRVD